MYHLLPQVAQRTPGLSSQADISSCQETNTCIDDWNAFGKWIFIGAIIFLVFLLIILALHARHRILRNRTPIYGTAWLVPNYHLQLPYTENVSTQTLFISTSPKTPHITISRHNTNDEERGGAGLLNFAVDDHSGEVARRISDGTWPLMRVAGLNGEMHELPEHEVEMKSVCIEAQSRPTTGFSNL